MIKREDRISVCSPIIIYTDALLVCYFYFFLFTNIRFRYRVESVLLSREYGDHPPREEVREIIRFSFFKDFNLLYFYYY